MKPRPKLALFAALCLGATAAGAGMTSASFRGETESPANEVSAAPDFVAPEVSVPAVGKLAGGLLGSVAAGGGYHVYAKVSDTGNPASGVASVSADLGAVSAGKDAVPLEPGTFEVEGKSYNYRSAELAVDASLADGDYSFSITAKDGADNARTYKDPAVKVDSSAPSAADVQSANGGSTAGRPEEGDTVTFTYSEPVDPYSVLTGWGGGKTNVVARIVNGGLLGLGNDELVVYDPTNTTQLSLGSVDLGRTDYVGTELLGGLTTFGASLSPSTMVADGRTITVTLGTPAELDVNTAADSGTMAWAPSDGATDAAGNKAASTAAQESGAADKEF